MVYRPQKVRPKNLTIGRSVHGTASFKFVIVYAGILYLLKPCLILQAQ